ncbi:DMT family transporter [Sphingomonas donggukensis]|uniref:DMT family transporter n=1 Tax=Sphingomonas donggukensis TaxID=2949093 RepID=A0ABY4TRV7_9SPHN|nr:DMT family transporter [Sphingomonas donggukensis]URW75143.1 DMT family transporter [Sphingomonas donggukensis]
MNRQYRAYAMLACAMLFWAGNAIVGRAVRGDVPAATLSLLRWSGAFALLLPFAWRHLVADRAALVAGWKRVVGLGLIGVASFNTLYYFGLHDTTASNALLLQALIPGLVLVADRAIFGIRPPLAIVGGVVLATLGVAVIVFRGDPAALAALALGRGDVLILIAVTLWALYTSLLKLKPKVHPLSFLAATFGVAVIALVPVAGVELARGAVVRWSTHSLLAIAYVAVLPSLVSYLLFNQGVAAIGAARAGQAINLMPLFGALLAAGLLGEKLHGYHAIGMTMILAGLVIGLAMTRQPAEDQGRTSP